MSGVPVILIPGAKGTKLMNTNGLNFDVIYSAIQSSYETIYDLVLQENPNFDKEKEVVIKPADVEDGAYREIVTLMSREDWPVYIFGYDWRKSCQENGKKLEEFVDDLQNKLGVTSFNFVTHSMGGVVFECFLRELKGDYGLLNQAVITACPFKGSVNALMALAKGERGLDFSFFYSSDAFRKIARTFPSAYEMTPCYDRAFEKGGNDLYQLPCNPNAWQSNLIKDKMFVKRLDDLKKFRGEPTMPELDNFESDVKPRIVVIAGKGQNTCTKVSIIDKQNPAITNFFQFENPSKEGDGVVPLASATAYKGSGILTLVVENKFFDPVTHALFLNDGRVQNIIIKFFTKGGANPSWWHDLSGSVSEAQ